MPGQNNEARAERILDAAAELIQRWGYKKTTIDDIAKQAGVAKGTIYLHWKTREDLFLALLLRERLREAKAFEQQLANDPEGGTLHAMIKYATLAALKNPLLKALMLQDTEMLGELVHTEVGRRDTEQRIAANKLLLEMLRGKELIRTDIHLDAQLHMLLAITTGFMLIDQFLPEQYQFSPEEVADMVAETVRRTFETRKPTADEQRATTSTISSLIESVRKQQEYDQKEVES